MFGELSVSEIIIDEILIIETSGEMPEVAYHGAIHYMTSDVDGPGLNLAQSHLNELKLAVVEGYRRIIVRDITLENRDKGLYRGLARCAVNWNRLGKYCRAEGLAVDGVATEVCCCLKRFLTVELKDVRQGRQTCVNCSASCLYELAAEVGLEIDQISTDLEILFPNA